MKTILTGYHVNEDPFFESDQTIIFKGIRIRHEAPVILKFLKESHPTPAQISLLKHEYGMIKSLDSFDESAPASRNLTLFVS